jgi:hypothetical protein
MDNYIVYAGYIGEQCVYVGEGKPDRYLHLTSGVSHVYKANEAHFKGMAVAVKILEEGLSKESCVLLEREYISELKPLWNKVEFIGGADFKRKLKKTMDRKFRGSLSSAMSLQYELCKYFFKVINTNGEAHIGRGELERNGFRSKLMAELSGGTNYKAVQELFEVTKTPDNKGYMVQARCMTV